MTTHLTQDEQIAALDGALEPGRMAHAQTCDLCRDAVAELRTVLARVAGADVPEPSPLFWDHFSARVKQATAVDDASRRTWNWRSWLATAAALTALVLVVVMRLPHPPQVPAAGAASPQATVAEASTAADSSDIESWPAVVQAAADLSADDMQSALSLSADALPLVEDLSPAERAAFVRLLHAEMERTQ
jgi:hypothetical protein